MIATAMGLAPEWVERIRLAAPMHDVGKIGIPDQILLKPGRLTDPEREIMQRHTRIGHAILRDGEESPLLEMAAEIAMYHHERWDGTGYPQGLKGEEIPLAARIVALCDVYDALRSPRPYKQAWPLERAQAYVVEQAGLHFDPCLVEVAKGIFQQIEEMQHRLSDPLVQLAEVEVDRAAAAATATLLRSVVPLPA